ncbi:ABC transporter substrate-binding protein [Streptomonospora litoralis]|uniref:Glutathione-binding protein GsiB n=1 Tax=Streptomonospora litoralis TaxID=2498135 RepID=A0A4P6Q2Y5_9ACTN|nr:ABC transporter substrate-binding protein [Streptomonospora litoralis]QBI53017.1 Glutathione-binding protein GsiB precursor [Streptomonospora litoralis]
MTPIRIAGRRFAVAACVAALGATAACGGGTAGSENALRVGVPVTILSIDPQGTEIGERTTLMTTQHIFDPLVRVADGEPQAMLAESWENPDPNTWVFHLRSGVTFHDDSEFDSQDAKASLERMFAADTPMAPLWDTIESVEAPDKSTVEISTTQPTGALLTNLSLVSIASAEQIEDGRIESDQPAGTGPFAVEEFSSGERTVLTANADYWGGAPELDRLELREIPEVSSRLTALETGEIDLTYDLPPDQMGQVENFDGVTLDSVPSLNNYFVWFNNEREPFDDERVRKAVWHAVDFKSIQSELFGESAIPASAPVPEAAFGAGEFPPYEYDPEKARDLLEEAGHPNGFETSIQWSSECCANIRPMTQTIVSDLKEVGIEVEMKEKERGQWLDDLLGLNFDMNIQDNAVITGDAEYSLGRLYTCDAQRLGYCSEEYDAAIDKASQELDPDRRAELMVEAQRILWEDAPAMWPLDLAANAAWNDRVQGFEPAPNNIPNFRPVSVGE